ncbi:MAG: 4-(cytidine 5'-diphospho)-2-C-methyl-D-erythritol kinase [Acidobacteria bacterium]|nr:4-(cytidine 5'-diphospho)-2-C-methyl-D-erythritol kinase [Acidobacteriota bacterium]
MPLPLSLPAHAKINLDLRVLDLRPDGYHDLRTIVQTLALHDTVTLIERRGPFAIECTSPEIPTDRRNLIWKAASLLWRAAIGRRRRTSEPSGVLVRLDKRIPSQAGLGGGSADAAVTLLGLARLWQLSLDVPTLSRLASRLGADVPFFLAGGTALGLGRGDDIYPLVDLPATSVVVVQPSFGVSTVEAYRWFDVDVRRPARERPRPLPPGWPAWASSLKNDLEPVVASHHPTIARIKQALLEAGAATAAMSGSGSAVFGLFERPAAARRTASDLARPGWQTLCTKTVSRVRYEAALRRALAPSGRGRIS